MRSALIVLLLLLTAGCTVPLRMYEGPLLEQHEIATLAASWEKCEEGKAICYGYGVMEIDSIPLVAKFKAGQLYKINSGSPIELLPGRHTAVVTIMAAQGIYHNVALQSSISKTLNLSFEVEAGHHYLVHGVFVDEESGAWRGWIEDVQTKKIVSWEEQEA